jgi:hypothetical protein
LPTVPLPVPPGPISPQWQRAQALIQAGNYQAAQQIINDQLRREPSLAGVMGGVAASQRAQLPPAQVQVLQNQALQLAQSQITQGVAQPIPPDSVERYLEGKFGDDLGRVRKAMQKLAKAYRPKELAVTAYPLYEQFRPEIPEGVRGWGAVGDLDLGLIESMAKRR